MKVQFILQVMIAGAFQSACFRLPVVTNDSSSHSSATKLTAAVQAATESGGVQSAFSATSTVEQAMAAPETSAIKGAAVVFSPGALQIDTTISMEESASLATDALSAELGIETTLTQSGTPVAILSSTSIDASKPFELSLPLPVGLGLTEDADWSRLAVFYRVINASESKNYIGVIPRGDIVVDGGVAKIATTHFGSFQTVLTEVPITEKKSVETTTAILTKAESVKLPAISLSGRTPFLVKANSVVEISGSNFRSSMVLAIAGKKVEKLEIISDSRASFVAPSSESFGLVNLTADQDGVSQAVSMFYAGGKSDFPISTKAESEVCSGEQYYDASGLLKTGTRVCTASTSVSAPDLSLLIPGNIKSGVTINGVSGTLIPSPAACSSDGAQGCVTNASFPAMLASGAGSKIVSGQTLGLIAGTASGPADCNSDGQVGCLTVANYPAVNIINVDGNKASIHNIVSIAGISGTMAYCASEAEVNCITHSSYKAAGISNLDAKKNKIHTSVNIAGVAGTLASCADGGSACFLAPYALVTQPLKAVDITNIAGIVKTGATIAGVTGEYPSSSYPLDGSGDGFPDLNPGTLTSQLTSPATFGWFDRFGARRSAAGDSDLAASNILASASIFGVNGSIAIPDPWDVRHGTTYGGQTGKLNFNCRNMADLSTLDVGVPIDFSVNSSTDTLTALIGSHGFANGNVVSVFFAGSFPGFDDQTLYHVINATSSTLQLSATSGGAPIDITSGGTIQVARRNGAGGSIASTIDDANNGGAFPSLNPHGASGLSCGGLEATAGDSNVWRDVTVSTCISTGDDCSFEDKISRLQWSESFGSLAYGAALAKCEDLTFAGTTDWRLPTQKELLAAYEHGILSVGDANWITDAAMRTTPFWSATRASDNPGQAYSIVLSNGVLSKDNMTATASVSCVRSAP